MLKCAFKHSFLAILIRENLSYGGKVTKVRLNTIISMIEGPAIGHSSLYGRRMAILDQNATLL